MLVELQNLLDENTDSGVEPMQAFEYVSASCANDIESFLYDFITEQIESENATYASELVDGFRDYMKDKKWFDFLSVKVAALSGGEDVNALIWGIFDDTELHPSLDFNFEILSFLVHEGESALFLHVLKETIALINTEEDFQDLLMIAADFCLCLENDAAEAKLQNLIQARSMKDDEDALSESDPDFQNLIDIIKSV